MQLHWQDKRCPGQLLISDDTWKHTCIGLSDEPTSNFSQDITYDRSEVDYLGRYTDIIFWVDCIIFYSCLNKVKIWHRCSFNDAVLCNTESQLLCMIQVLKILHFIILFVTSINWAPYFSLPPPVKQPKAIWLGLDGQMGFSKIIWMFLLGFLEKEIWQWNFKYDSALLIHSNNLYDT